MLPVVWAFVVIVVVYYVLEWATKWRKMAPGPYGLPILGYAPYIDFRQPWKTYRQLSKKYGPIISITATHGCYQTILHDPDDILELFNRPECIARPWSMISRVAADDQNVALVSSRGNIWQANRRFTMRTLRDFGFAKSSLNDVILPDVKAVMNSFEKSDGKPMEIGPNLNVAIVNIIWKMVGNQHFEHDDANLLEFLGKLEEAIQALGEVGPAFLRPWMIHLTPGYRKKNAIINKFKQEFVKFRKVLEEHKESRDPEFCRDYIDAYLKEIEETSGTAGITEENLLYSIRQLFFAGSETTATSTRWAIVLMALNPEVQRKAQEEIDRIIGKDREIRYEDRTDLPYLEGIVHEVLRYSSVAALGIPHTTTEDIYYKGCLIPKESFIFANQYHIHHNPRYWPEPFKFDPTRFLDEDGKFRTTKIKAFLPFGLGKRQCIGESLAKMEIFLFLANFLQRFSFGLSDDEQIPDPREVFLTGAVVRPPPFKIVPKMRF